jgi:hypothetical protein
MPKIAKPKTYSPCPALSFLYDRGDDYPETEIGGIVYRSTVPVAKPVILGVNLDREGMVYIHPDGSRATGTDADLAAEFAAATPTNRAPKF